MKLSTHDKARIETVTARFVRKADGRINKREAKELARRYAVDVHWRFLRTDGDKLALRAPGDFARRWEEWLGETFKRERRAPRRWASVTFNGNETARHMGYYFGWLGPQSGMWPGDSLAWDPDYQVCDGRVGAWRVAHAKDCACGACWRPAPASRPGLAKTRAPELQAVHA